jgi:hypothetical protein
VTDFSWHAVYYSDLQSLYALIVIPLAFLAWRAASAPDLARGIVPEASRFVAGLSLFFAVATMIDPLSTGPLVRTEVLRDTLAPTLIPFFFVLLGDLRVLLLAIGVARPDRSLKQNLIWAGGMTLIVPVVTGVGELVVGLLWEEVHSQIRWMIYEFSFLMLSIFLSRSWIPRTLGNSSPAATYLRALFGFSAAYYALWLIADVFIVVAGLDLGWAIRIVPNQLYYAFWVPFAYWRFFSVEPANAER